MKSATPMLEELEPRIAPAVVVFTSGGNLLSSGDQGYLSQAEADGDATLLVKCTGGKALVFWDSIAREIKGISVADGANIEVLGNVKGDIVTNLQASGFLSDSDNNPANGLDGGNLLPSSIAGIKTNAYFDSKGNAQNGDVGRIIAGGSVSNVNLNGRLNGVYTGDGIFDAVASAALPDGSPAPVEGIASTQFTFTLGQNFDTSGPANISTMTLKMSDSAFAPNASINGVAFSSGIDVQFFAGDGANGAKGPAATGGSISKIDFVGGIVDASATGFFVGKSYSVSAGHGGDVTDGDGGAGGSINGITETNSGGNTFIHAGAGGSGELTKGRGGVGGSITKLDLHGGVIQSDIASGTGGNGATGGHAGSVSFANITSQGPISLAGPFLADKYSGALQKDFFVINRSTSEMSLVDGSTLAYLPVIPAQAAGPVDAIVADLNNDTYLDVVVVYADQHLGILINNGGDGTFKYTVKDIGFEPFRVLAGDFIGDGGNPEITIISTNKLQTALRLYSAADPTEATSFVSDPTVFKPLALKKGNLADAAGGSSPLGFVSQPQTNLPNRDFFWGMQLTPSSSYSPSDLALGFADGTLQGVLSTGKAFTTTDAPKITLAGGIRDLDFNFPDLIDSTSVQALAVVNAAGTAASVVGVVLPPVPPTVEGEPPPPAPDKYIFSPGAPLPIKASYGTVFQAIWTNGKLPADEGSLMLLASNSTSSTVLFYSGTQKLMAGYQYDFLINSVANNHLTAPVLVNASGGGVDIQLSADSYIFTTGNVTIAKTYQGALPTDFVQPELLDIELPFAPKSVGVTTGSGGTGTSGPGGNGGDIKSLNIDSNFADVTLGDGGTSGSGAAGSGGSLNNTASFLSASGRIRPTFGITNDLAITAGDGATVTGVGASSRGGNGGSITGVIFTSTGHFEFGWLVLGNMVLTAGDGGSSQSLSAGNGGSISTTSMYCGNDATVIAGRGGNGTVGAKASGGHGGAINGFTGGNPESGRESIYSGTITATAGVGGDSEFANAGNGGGISTIKVEDRSNPVVSLIFTAGTGGNSIGGSGGAGGALSNFTFTGGVLGMSSGNGGNSTGPVSKGTGGAGGAITGINAEIIASGYMAIQSGGGGSGVGAAGGTGGSISNVSLKLDPDSLVGDKTLAVSVLSGDGGNGSKGGTGGGVTGVSCVGVYNNPANDGFVTVIDPIAMKFVSGKGGNGSTAEGGAGGAINFSKALLGLSRIDSSSTNPGFLPADEALRIFTGDGGTGATKGGAGGSVSGVKAANVKNGLGDSIPTNLLGGAFIETGDGGATTSGDGGAGGSVTGVKLSVERQGTDPTGNLRILTGGGGNSASGKGGAGGAVLNSNFTSVNGSNDDGYGVLLQTGGGGTGGLSGGAGGSLTSLTVSATSIGLNGTDADIYGVVLVSGDGGKGTGPAKSIGGAGGSITGITQPKDVYSVINLVQAGSGGNSSADTVGGLGGSVSNVKSAGAIGAEVARALPTDPGIRQGQFNTIPTSALIDALVSDHHQGVYAGLGGTGLARGANGSVSNISAPAIAAIGAANLAGTFEQAAIVTKITTLLLGFDINGSGTYQNGDGFVKASAFNVSKDLISLDPSIVSTASLIARTTPFVNP